MTTLSVKIPMIIDDVNGIGMVDNIKDLAKQNLKNLILTNPGEQLFYYDYGVGIDSILFKNSSDTSILDLKDRIYSQIKKYIPYISVIDSDISVKQDRLYIKIVYYVKTTLEGDSLEIDVDINSR